MVTMFIEIGFYLLVGAVIIMLGKRKQIAAISVMVFLVVVIAGLKHSNALDHTLDRAQLIPAKYTVANCPECVAE